MFDHSTVWLWLKRMSSKRYAAKIQGNKIPSYTGWGQLCSKDDKLIYMGDTAGYLLEVFMATDTKKGPLEWTKIERQDRDQDWPTRRVDTSLTVAGLKFSSLQS